MDSQERMVQTEYIVNRELQAVENGKAGRNEEKFETTSGKQMQKNHNLLTY